MVSPFLVQLSKRDENIGLNDSKTSKRYYSFHVTQSLAPNRFLQIIILGGIALLRATIVTDPWVAWSVCRSITLVNAAKTSEPIEMPFGLRTQVGPGRDQVLDVGPDIPMGRGNLGGSVDTL